MSKRDKLFEKMRRNVKGDWQIEDLKKIAEDYDLKFRQPGTSHVTFSKEGTEFRLTVPSHKPIKPIYIKKFIELIDQLIKEEETND